VFIFDDSGSMNTILQDSPLNQPGSLLKASRWEELQYFAKISIEIASLFDQNGPDVYFLNRKPSPIKSVTASSSLSPFFSVKPAGFTPLPRILGEVLHANSNTTLGERKLLILIATDGEPTDERGRPAIKEFKQIMMQRSVNCYTTVVACTDDNSSLDYLNRWDRCIPRLDVVDDYQSERKEIKKIKGNQFPFSFGDYVVKSLIGSIDPEMDGMDEKKFKCNIL
jgi:hypothetical protein